MKIELNILGMLVEYENDQQEGQEYSIMWKVGNVMVETPILKIEPRKENMGIFKLARRHAY